MTECHWEEQFFYFIVEASKGVPYHQAFTHLKTFFPRNCVHIRLKLGHFKYSRWNVCFSRIPHESNFTRSHGKKGQLSGPMGASLSYFVFVWDISFSDLKTDKTHPKLSSYILVHFSYIIYISFQILSWTCQLIFLFYKFFFRRFSYSRRLMKVGRVYIFRYNHHLQSWKEAEILQARYHFHQIHSEFENGCFPWFQSYIFRCVYKIKRFSPKSSPRFSP